MLRGVNKNIIEITQTDSQYFEKAILFVRQDQPGRNSTELENQAKAFVSSVTAQAAAPAAGVGAATQMKERLDLKGLLVRVGIGAAAVVGTGILLMLL